jgi:hypothetical protein
MPPQPGASTSNTIPRVPHLVPHLRALLGTLRDGATFEDCRRRYTATAADLAARGRGRAVASRVGDQEAYWAPTADLLSEAMLLGLVERQQVPSARAYLDRHAERIYGLTRAGLEALEIGQDDEATFTTLVVDALLAAHPPFHRYVMELDRAPMVIPVIDVSDVERASKAGSLEPLAGEAADQINSGPAGPVVTAETVLAEMRAWSKRRFAGRSKDDPPTRKARAEVLSDACASVGLTARSIPVGATDLRNLRAWGSNLRIVDQSRYTTGTAGPFWLWLAADLVRSGPARDATGGAPLMALSTTPAGDTETAGLHLVRRGLAGYGEAVADALVDAYFRQAAKEHLEAPYLPIHCVRAEAALRCRVMRKVVDRVIEALVARTMTREGLVIQLRIGSPGNHPESEPVYGRGSPRYVMSIAKHTVGTAT